MMLIITCEHASNAMPSGARKLKIPHEVLDSHRGYDIGALPIYKELVDRLKPDFCSAGEFSRLFIDLNRSLRNNKNLFNEFWEAYDSQQIEDLKKQALDYHQKYRGAVENFVKRNKGVPIIHLAIHSFTPVLNGVVRNADVGILYDPSRAIECNLADIFIHEIHAKAPELKVRKNYPYLGKTDGLCTRLRKLSPFYAGFEIEFNQGLFG